MKGKTIFIFILSSIMILSLSLFISSLRSLRISSQTLFENLEALAQTEGAIIVCNTSVCGRCFEEKKAFPVYKCNWTGMQADYCDCDKAGWL